MEAMQRGAEARRLEDIRNADAEGSLSPGDVIRVELANGTSIVLDPTEPYDEKASSNLKWLFRDSPEMLARIDDYDASYGNIRPWVPKPGDPGYERFQKAAAAYSEIPFVPDSWLESPQGRLLFGLPYYVGGAGTGTALPGYMAGGAVFGAGLGVALPGDGEGFLEFTGRDWQRAIDGAAGGAIEGPIGGAAGRGALALLRRLRPEMAAHWLGTPTATTAGETAVDTLYAATTGDPGISGRELAMLGLGAGLGAGADVGLGSWRTIASTVPAAYSVMARQPWGPAMEQPDALRFSGYGFASTKSLEQRTAELETYLDNYNADMARRFPEHWQHVLRLSDGQGYTIDNMNLRRPLVQESMDVVAFLKARDAMARGLAQGRVTEVPTLNPDVLMVGRPTPWQTQRPGAFLHGGPDLTPFLRGGKLAPRMDQQFPGKLGLFGSDRGIGRVLDKSFDPSKMPRTPIEEWRPGFIELPGSQLLLPPKLSPQAVNRATPISIRLLEQLGPSGRIIRPELPPPGSGLIPPHIPPPPHKRHRATTIPVNDQGRILLVKGTKDNLWMLPGGDVKRTESPLEAGRRELTEETGLRSAEGETVFSLDADTTYHDVSVIPVRGDSTPKGLQDKEIQDYTWWDGETALPLSRSTRTILSEYMGKEPPRTRSRAVVQGREAYDWWPSLPALAEVEGVFGIGGLRPSIDFGLSRRIVGGVQPEGTLPPELYLTRGADPITRRQIAMANLLHLLTQARLRKPAGVTFESGNPFEGPLPILRGVQTAKAHTFVPEDALPSAALLPDGPARTRPPRDGGDPDAPTRTQPSRRRDAATATPGDYPVETPIDTPTRYPVETPIDTPTRYPVETPTDTPPGFPPDTPTDTPPGYPPDTPTDTPPGYPPDTPTDTPPGYPPDTPTDTPPGYPPDTPTDTPPGYPPDTPTDTPPGYPPDTPTDTPPGYPPDTPTDTPPGYPPDTPTDTPPGYPPDTPTDTPPGYPPDTPTDTPPGYPPDTPTDTPPGYPPDTPPDTPPGYPPDVPPDTPPDTPTDTPRRRLPLRRGGSDQDDDARGLGLQYPKIVRFQTVEDVVVDLETGDTTRTPVGNLPTQTLEVVEHSQLPYTEQHYTGRITDVATDDQGHPFIVQRGQYQGQRERKITAPTERDPEERERIRKGLEKDIAAAEAAGANRQSGSTGVGRRRGSGISTPKPGPTVNRGQGPKSRYGNRTSADRFMRTRKLKV